MTINYLEQLEFEISSGATYFACPASGNGEWFISKDFEKCVQRAQRTANGQGFEANVFRLLTKGDVATGDAFLTCRKIMEPGARGEPNLRFALVDTKEAAELIRDVSHGGSPYFGAAVEKVVSPDGKGGHRL